ncbi:uncharacterized protein DUF1799 [Pseudoduganella lurida]|uniref:Uncharacterized protein DUF1799 n=1 Tax=Pseudoduganella lurida TaxID=1036180 RepID=A0A562R7W4_9BURK|nr:DUF1799 domain-containing protein [Pseudoduganella lurida]TWI65168.1 uncharacterized protein DUF1799 [Pseudoduganella lurida]
MIAAAEAPVQPAVIDFQVWEENWRTVSLFVGLATQWRMHIGMAGVHYQGLDYGAVEVALRLERVPRADWPQTFRDLQTMERAALPLLNDTT